MDMEKILVLDTNAIVDFANRKPGAIDLEALFTNHKCTTSFIVKLESLGFPLITDKEEKAVSGLLSKIPVLPSNDAIEAETIQIRRKTTLKLPDAIIAATAVVIGGEVVTKDVHFLNCAYPSLRIYASP
jgi:predicted nucleic acid-binding protein